MHISLDSALGRQRRLNQVGETISSIAAPTAAYSLRSLTGGDPKAVRVRRDTGGAAGDDDEQDFTVSEINSGALVAFVGSGNDGFVSKWYDQSGNSNDASQSTAANQPKIVDSGSLNASGGLEFDGTNDILTLTSSISFQNKAACVIALQDGQDSVNDYTLGVSGDNRGLGFKSNKTRWFFTTNVIDIDNSSVQTGQKLYTALHDGTTNNPNVKSYVNGSEIVDSSPDSDQGEANSSSAADQIGARRTLSFLEGTLTELIIYDTDQTNNRAALEAEIINHYGL